MKIIKKIYRGYLRCAIMLYGALTVPLFAADQDPWQTDTSSIQNGDVIGGLGKTAEKFLKWGAVILGALLMLMGIVIIINRLQQDAKTKEHSNFLLQMVLVGGAITAGLLLIAYAFSGLNYGS